MLMKRISVILIFIAVLLPMKLFSQTYSSLWKQVETEQKKDTPRSAMAILEKIRRKAEKEKQYGHLIKAELLYISTQTSITPDSLRPEVKRLVAKELKLRDADPVLAAVYETVLSRIYNRYSHIDEGHAYDISREYERLALRYPEKLAEHKASEYEPLLVEGYDSRWFENDLLSVIGYELDAYKLMHDYYVKTHLRTAACLTAMEVANEHRWWGAREMKQSEYIRTIDSLIAEYGDLKVAGELALSRYEFMERAKDVTLEDRTNYINYALGRWGDWPRLNELRNNLKEMTQPTFNVDFGKQVSRPGQPRMVEVTRLRNIDQLTMTVTQVNLDATKDYRLYDRDVYAQVKKAKIAGTERVINRQFIGLPNYQVVDKDTFELEGLPVGIYLVEFTTSNNNIEPVRFLHHVSDVYLMQQQLPEKKTRFVVVSATTGQPLKGAKLRFIPSRYFSGSKTPVEVNCDAKGEAISSLERNRDYEIFAYTDTDQSLPTIGNKGGFSYYDNKHETNDVDHIYTDRAIYRPGQTVHVAVVAFRNTGGVNPQARTNQDVTIQLFDANWKEIGKQTLKTDEYGTVSADFVLPKDGLNGRYSLSTSYGSEDFRVEEYKRPTFQVEFPKVDQPYHAGDTVVVTAHALTYAGVPVQGAKVKYTVTRRQSFWWRYYGGGADQGEEIKTGTATTDEEGAFKVEMPMEIPESDYPTFYNITAVADVTDQAGETRTGEISLPIGTRDRAFSCDIPKQTERDSLKQVTFALRNAAGVPVNGKVTYQVDKGKMMTAQANTPVPFNMHLNSGKHHLHAVCGKDTIDTDFVVFTLHDKKPCLETHDWYYLSAKEFPRKGGAVHQQIGTTDPNTHVVYTIISGDKVVESGTFELNAENQNRSFVYKDEWGSGLLLNYAWVRDGVLYEHSQTIAKPLPDKRLNVEWATFRDRLKPGQEEEWTLKVTNPDGTPSKAQLLAVLYDKSLDPIAPHQWTFNPELSQSLPYTSWNGMSFGRLYGQSDEPYKSLKVTPLTLYHFDESLFNMYEPMVIGYGMRGGRVLMKNAAVLESAPMEMEEAADYMADEAEMKRAAPKEKAEKPKVEEHTGEEPQLRENFDETAFFFPQLASDATGNVVMKFTLPESLTTWQFMGMAHDPQMNYGFLLGQSVAKKDVMVQPQMPRFVRAGDEAQIAMKVFNTTEIDMSGQATMELLDPATEAVVFTKTHRFNVKAGQTEVVNFNYQPDGDHSMLICRMTAKGKKFSDGEQHYLPVLPDREQVLNSRVITQHHAGVKEFDIKQLFPEGTTDRTLTVEYTNNPAWMMIQALPALADIEDDNAISQAARYYVNAIGQYLMNQSPKIKETIDAWNLEEGDETTLNSYLERDEELKNIVLNETPWVLDADMESNRQRQLADYFNEAKMDKRLSQALDKLRSLQLFDGSWSWWKGMHGNCYITTEVTEMLVRLNVLVGQQEQTASMIKQAFGFLGNELVKEMDELKKEAKHGVKDIRPSEWAVQTLYAMALDGRKLSDKTEEAKRYMVDLLAKRTNDLTIYGKAIVAVVLAKNGKEKKAAEYLQSIREYSVMTEEMGRYYDSPKAYYSWFDYKIPTEVAALEAIQMLQPSDLLTVEEMQRWLLMSKRTQAWDTPINSVNAVYVFMKGNNGLLEDREPAQIMADGQPLVVEARNAGLGSEKHRLSGDDIPQQLTINKSSEGTSWGAVYAQFTQKTTEVTDAATGLTIKREIIGGEQLHVGDRVKVRITIEATQDFDFVQVSDKRAACLEPVQQLSGYRYGYYCSPKDYVTNYFFDRMAKGKHVVETEYFIDREGTYTTGSCTVQCAYAPEYAGRTHAETLQVVK